MNPVGIFKAVAVVWSGRVGSSGIGLRTIYV